MKIKMKDNKININKTSSNKIKLNINNNGIEFNDIDPEYRETLYKIDKSMSNYRENKTKPGTKEYKDNKRAEEIFNSEFHFS